MSGILVHVSNIIFLKKKKNFPLSLSGDIPAGLD